MKKTFILLVALTLVSSSSIWALEVYPLNDARILAGSNFDFKVEFDGIINQADAKITINRKDYKGVLNGQVEFIAEESGAKASALFVRKNFLKTPGSYEVTVQAGKESKTVRWEIFAAARKAQAKNVIFLIADGLSIGHRTAARILSEGVSEGKANGKLAMDQMQRMGLMGTSSVDAITVDSANSMSAYMTGQKSSINALGVYADRTDDPMDDPRQETIVELIRRTTKKSVGIVSDAELEDATPAATVSHTRKRDEKAAIVQFFLDMKPDVLLGGGSAYFLPKSVTGSKRKDDKDYISLFKEAGYNLATSATELKASLKSNPQKLLGLFHPGNLDGVLDRLFLKKGTVPKYPDQPDLTEMTQAALDVLSKNKDGFFLMVEAGLVDKYTHPMDWERAVYDTIMFDKVVALAQDFAKKNPDTLIVVTGDHTHSISVYGTVDDSKPGELRDKVGTYAAAGYPNYEDKDGDGYPDTPDVSKRLAVGYGNHPDYYETFKPKMDNPFNPTIKNEKGQYVANDQYKDQGVLMTGNLAYSDSTEVHSVDDQILSMSGPGSEQILAYQDNTSVFEYMVLALGLKP